MLGRQVLCDFSGIKEKRCGPEKSVQKCEACRLTAWLYPVFGFRLCCNELWTSWLGLKCLVATDGERTDHVLLQKGKIDQSIKSEASIRQLQSLKWLWSGLSGTPLNLWCI